MSPDLCVLSRLTTELGLAEIGVCDTQRLFRFCPNRDDLVKCDGLIL
jgi:hypothetical protein